MTRTTERSRPTPVADDERGSITLFAVVLLVLVAVMGAGVARLGAVELQRARVEAVADVTALAAVQAGSAGAAAVAAASGATLRRTEVRADGSVAIEVARHGAVASAAADARGAVILGDPDPGSGRR